MQSTLLSTLTKTQSEAASYEFTTLTCIPGVIEYKGANIQLLDLPGIIEGASQGKGRGKQVCTFLKFNIFIPLIKMYKQLPPLGYCCCKNCWFGFDDAGCHQRWCAEKFARKRIGKCRNQVE